MPLLHEKQKIDGEIDNDGWQYAIDIDESDLPFLRPCTQTLTTNPNPNLPKSPIPADRRHVIPGPAGAVHSAMLRRSAAAGEEQRVADSDLDFDVGCEEDEDFKMDSWLSALRFLGTEVDSVCPISSIETRDVNRVPKMAAIVKSCKPNGLGDLFLSLKDPTGSIGASVHRKVLTENSLGGNISVGCVLILKQVVAFCPAHSARYLNVTSNNILKLIDKDCGPPEKQPLSSFTTKCGFYGKNKETMLNREGQEQSSRKRVICGDNEENRGTWNYSRNLGFSKSDDCSVAMGSRTVLTNTKTGGKHGMELLDNVICASEEDRAVRQRLVHDELRGNLVSSAVRERIEVDYSSFSSEAVGTNDTSPVSAAANNPDFGTDMENEPDAAENTSQSCKIDGKLERKLNSEFVLRPTGIDLRDSSLSCSGKIDAITMPAKSESQVNKAKIQITKETVGQWTDEQLMELFSDFHDDDGLLLPII